MDAGGHATAREEARNDRTRITERGARGLRSLLFCPADRPDRYAKAAARADAVILDLEDAVAPAAKPAARDAVAASRAGPRTHDRAGEPAGTADFDADLAALRATAYRTVMLAKAQVTADVRALAGYDVVALVSRPPPASLHAAALAARTERRWR